MIKTKHQKTFFPEERDDICIWQGNVPGGKGSTARTLRVFAYGKEILYMPVVIGGVGVIKSGPVFAEINDVFQRVPKKTRDNLIKVLIALRDRLEVEGRSLTPHQLAQSPEADIYINLLMPTIDGFIKEHREHILEMSDRGKIAGGIEGTHFYGEDAIGLYRFMLGCKMMLPITMLLLTYAPPEANITVRFLPKRLKEDKYAHLIQAAIEAHVNEVSNGMLESYGNSKCMATRTITTFNEIVSKKVFAKPLLTNHPLGSLFTSYFKKEINTSLGYIVATDESDTRSDSSLVDQFNIGSKVTAGKSEEIVGVVNRKYLCDFYDITDEEYGEFELKVESVISEMDGVELPPQAIMLARFAIKEYLTDVALDIGRDGIVETLTVVMALAKKNRLPILNFIIPVKDDLPIEHLAPTKYSNRVPIRLFEDGSEDGLVTINLIKQLYRHIGWVQNRFTCFTKIEEIDDIVELINIIHAIAVKKRIK